MNQITPGQSQPYRLQQTETIRGEGILERNLSFLKAFHFKSVLKGQSIEIAGNLPIFWLAEWPAFEKQHREQPPRYLWHHWPKLRKQSARPLHFDLARFSIPDIQTRAQFGDNLVET